jgi:hypothetical protein
MIEETSVHTDREVQRSRRAYAKRAIRILLAVLLVVAGLMILFLAASGSENKASSPAGSSKEWKFVVAGDSRNCGDVIMPMIAEAAAAEHPAFYWHLGDLRATTGPDEDMGKFDAKTHALVPMGLAAYHDLEWKDFQQKQVAAFDKQGIPFYLGIGNHETAPPKSREEFLKVFHDLLNIGPLKKQREQDKEDTPETYYHWIKDGIDFIYLDNATGEQFDAAQMKWIKTRLDHDQNDPSIRTVVLGMHKGLPGSYTDFHSMSETPAGVQSGRCVYRKLLELQKQASKQVYVLASHSHFYMENIYDTPYWKKEGVLPGWIIGTAGAVRYRVPAGVPAGTAKTDVYGYLVGTVNADGQPGAIRFEFREISKPAGDQVNAKKDLINFCFDQNRSMEPTVNPAPPPETSCE